MGISKNEASRAQSPAVKSGEKSNGSQRFATVQT